MKQTFTCEKHPWLSVTVEGNSRAFEVDQTKVPRRRPVPLPPCAMYTAAELRSGDIAAINGAVCHVKEV